MSRSTLVAIFSAIIIAFVMLFTGVIFNSYEINRLEQREKANRVKLERLRTRVYILEGEINRGKWDAREAIRREVFKGAVRRVEDR